MRDLNKLGDELIERMPQLKPTSQGMSEVYADIIFYYRVRNRLTQKQLADKAEVYLETIRRIEGGSGGITDQTYEKVFKVLDIKLQENEEFVHRFIDAVKKQIKEFSDLSTEEIDILVHESVFFELIKEDPEYVVNHGVGYWVEEINKE